MNYRLLKTQFLITIFLTFISTLFIFEIPPRVISFYEKKISNKNYKQRCFNIKLNEILFKYGSCPNNIYIKKRSKDYPIIEETLSYTDSFGGRVEEKLTGKKFDKNKYNLYLIGDSFIQADELPYEKTVYGIINNSLNKKLLKAYGFGYSSWNTEQYLDSIKAINANNSLYDIFIFPNDYLPSYNKSRYGALQKKSRVLKKNSHKNPFKYFLNKSVTFQKLKDAYLSQKSTKITQKFWDKYTKEKNKCEFLDNNKNNISPRLVDYLYFSLPYSCWTEIHKESYNLVLQDIKNMKKEANKRKSKIRFIYLPPGFSFIGENYPGKTHYYYGIPKNVEIKQTGLIQRLENDIGKSFIDLETPIRMELSKKKQRQFCLNENCNNLYYFGYDGHLNDKGHNFLYEYLYLNSNNIY